MLIAFILYGVLHIELFVSVILQVFLFLFIDLLIFIVEVDSLQLVQLLLLHILIELFFCDDVGEAGSGQVTLGK
jgi:hypothetical protein